MGPGVLWREIDGSMGYQWVWDVSKGGSGVAVGQGVESWRDCGATCVSGGALGGSWGIPVGLARFCGVQGAMGGL